MNYDQNITAYLIPGNTLEEIEQSLAKEKFEIIKKLMRIYQRDIGDLARRIAQTKGIKCPPKKSKTGKQSGQKLANTLPTAKNQLFCL